jgi:hypothetical protein
MTGLIGFYVEVVKALDEINAPYMIVGAFGASSYGLTRSTMDVDIIVDLREENCDALADKFLPPRFYADPEQMRESIELGIMFNIIDTERGTKADLVPLSREPEYREAFANRIRRRFSLLDGSAFEAWCARPEDIIIGKLMAWDEGRSMKHPNDILAILDFKGQIDGKPLNIERISARASRISPDAAKLWRELLLKQRK